MNPHELHQLSTPKLVERFISTEVDQFQAELQGDIAKQNKCVRVATAIAKELKNRPGDQRSMLLELYKHPNVQVRLMAAKLTLAVAPSAGRQLLESMGSHMSTLKPWMLECVCGLSSKAFSIRPSTTTSDRVVLLSAE